MLRIAAIFLGIFILLIIGAVCGVGIVWGFSMFLLVAKVLFVLMIVGGLLAFIVPRI